MLLVYRFGMRSCNQEGCLYANVLDRTVHLGDLMAEEKRTNLRLEMELRSGTRIHLLPTTKALPNA